MTVSLRARARAAGLHLALSAVVVGVVGAVAFVLWYPGDYRTLADGGGLFLLVVAVDVVMGPLLTAVVYDPRKPRPGLLRDLSVIAALQVAALGYGLHVLAQARPVHLVFEVDRFRVVTAADIDRAQLDQAPAALRRLPWTGPTVIAARRSRTGEEMLDSVASALRGVDIAMQPARWVPYDAAMRAEALRRSAGLADRAAAWPADRRDDLRRAAASLAREAGVDPAQVRLLPVQSRFVNWTTVLAPDGTPIGFLEVDGF